MNTVRRNGMWAVAACLVLGLALTVAGCGKIAEKAAQTAVEKSTGVKVDKKKDSVTVTGPEGQTTTVADEGKLPEGFPSEVPVYEGTIKASMIGEQDGKKIFTVTEETPDDIETVMKYYTAQTKKEGWKDVTTVSVTDGGMVGGEIAGYQVTISMGTDDKGVTTISMSAAQK